MHYQFALALALLARNLLLAACVVSACFVLAIAVHSAPQA
jgi:hypothetical protein